MKFFAQIPILMMLIQTLVNLKIFQNQNYVYALFGDANEVNVYNLSSSNVTTQNLIQILMEQNNDLQVITLDIIDLK